VEYFGYGRGCVDAGRLEMSGERLILVERDAA
jgi:hypothetical protein